MSRELEVKTSRRYPACEIKRCEVEIKPEFKYCFEHCSSDLGHTFKVDSMDNEFVFICICKNCGFEETRDYKDYYLKEAMKLVGTTIKQIKGDY